MRKEERRKKRRKRRVLFLLVWTLFLFLILTSSTYAWFTVNRVVSIESLDIKVNVKGGLEISTDAINWKTVLTSEDIIGANETYPNSVNQLPSSLEPVSTGGIINNNGFMNMYYGVAQSLGTDEYYTLNSVLSTEEEGHGEDSGKFMAFDVFLKINSDSNLYLTDASGTVISDGMEDVGVGNSVRVAFIKEGLIDVDGAAGTIQKMNRATTDDAIIWEPNYDVHTQNGVNHAANLYNITTSLTGGSKIPYDGIISEFGYNQNIGLNRATSAYYPDLFKTVNIGIATPSEFTNYATVMENATRGIYKIRIYIWIEGQDVDCEDHASIGDVLFNIQFSTLEQ